MSPFALRQPRFTASYIPRSCSTYACTRRSATSQSSVPSSDWASCTICSTSTPCWSATDATQSFSQSELRKLGVTMEILTLLRCACAWSRRLLLLQHRPQGQFRPGADLDLPPVILEP